MTLKIGATMPMSSPYGYNTEKGYRILVHMFNEAGGLVVKGQRYKIEYIVYDDQYTAEGGRVGIERLLYRDRVMQIIGMVASQPVLGAISVAEAEKVILMADCTTTKFLEPQYHYTFRTGESPVGQPAKFVYLLRTYPNAKTIAFMGQDDEAGHADADAWTKIANTYGIKVLGTIFYPRGTTDFTAQATKIASLNPDLVQFCNSEGGADIGLQTKALRQAGYKGQPVQTEILDMEQLKAVASDEVLEGLTGRIPADLRPELNPLVKAFKAEWIKTYGDYPRLALGFMGAFYAFIAAVQKADSLDSDDIWNAMQGLEFDSLEGHCIMTKRPDFGVVDRFADCAVPLNFGRIINGKLIWEYEVTAEEAIEASAKVRGGVWR
jgi:branched-chain amino acid transport system substrate-binding protein